MLINRCAQLWPAAPRQRPPKALPAARDASPRPRPHPASPPRTPRVHASSPPLIPPRMCRTLAPTRHDSCPRPAALPRPAPSHACFSRAGRATDGSSWATSPPPAALLADALFDDFLFVPASSTRAAGGAARRGSPRPRALPPLPPPPPKPPPPQHLRRQLLRRHNLRRRRSCSCRLPRQARPGVQPIRVPAPAHDRHCRLCRRSLLRRSLRRQFHRREAPRIQRVLLSARLWFEKSECASYYKFYTLLNKLNQPAPLRTLTNYAAHHLKKILRGL